MVDTKKCFNEKIIKINIMIDENIIYNNKEQQQDKIWMQYALILAKKAQKHGEVPVGSVLIFDNRIIGLGYNCSINNHDPTGHAEIIALKSGGKVLKNYRLYNTTLYVTLEPCLMCLGAIINSRIKRLVLGTQHLYKKDKIYNTTPILNELKTKIIVDETTIFNSCKNIIIDFFKSKRNQNNI